MKVCVVSKYGEGAWFGWMMQRAGHQVDLTIEADECREAMRGLIENKEGIDEFSRYDLVLFDLTGFGKLSEIASLQSPTLGDSRFADKLEHDRLFGIQFMEQSGIKVPPYEHFTEVDTAIRFIKKTKKTYVFKPCGKDADASCTYVSKSAEDLLRYIEILWRTNPVKEFILQEFVKGTEVSTEVWMNDNGYYFLNHTLECKKLMNKELGPATGCSGNVVFASERENPLFIHGLKKALNALHDNSYVGMIDLNAIATEGEVYGLEWTPRMGYEGTCNVAHLLPMDFAEFMYRIATSETIPDLTARHSFCASVRLSIPPYPTDGLPRKFYKSGIPIEGLNRNNLTSFYSMDMRVNEENENLFETAGISGWLGAVLHCGETMGQAFDRVQMFIDSIRVPNLQYRTDIRGNVARRYAELEANGWLKQIWGAD